MSLKVGIVEEEKNKFWNLKYLWKEKVQKKKKKT
jgi:hypothetical protein